MDSLLANYGSDDEEDDAQPTLAKDASVPGHSRGFFKSIPPPKFSSLGNISSDKDAKRGSADELESEGWRVKVEIQDKKRPGSMFGRLPPPKSDSAELLEDCLTFVTSRRMENGAPNDRPSIDSEESSSMFLRLPPPSISIPCERTPKRLVAFKPPVKLSLLGTLDEDEESNKKRVKGSEESQGKSGLRAGGLAALLPPPKNSLGACVGLGGGVASGKRRAVMEISTDSSNISETVSFTPESRRVERPGLAVAGSSVGEFLDMENGVNSNPDCGYVPQRPIASNSGYYGPHMGNHIGDNPQGQIESGCIGYEVGAEMYDQTNAHYSEMCASVTEGTQLEKPSDPLAEVLEKERRKTERRQARGEAPPTVIEVKQADLTAGRLREDQLRSTGIAFGPSYQPVSSNKGKPSKLHRRKHQIGALYFDMRQKEMDLLDRRSKGNLTKAETQAKYGW